MKTPSTGIHTRINDKYRISSIYRNWGIIAAPELCGWETIVWEKQPGKEHEVIVHQEDSGINAQAVVERHAKLFHRIIENNGEWKNEEDL